jgi:hypothetical protein
MFTQAIETAAKFTRAIHSISRYYGSNHVQAGTATLFFVNADGWALTCSHVADQLRVGDVLTEKAKAFRNELSSLIGTKKEKKLLKELEKKYGYSKETLFELRNRFAGCVQGKGTVQVIKHKHKEVDAALIQFQGYSKLRCDTFPIFPSDTSSLRPGKFLCRLGFPFPEFTNFKYDEENDQIIWTDTGRRTTPRFPIEGMITRRLKGSSDNVIGFEMSTPGLRGQSGGPAFDIDGKVWGMQFETSHHDLNFDIDQKVMRHGKEKRVTDIPFFHTGLCVHVDVLKSFMKENNVQFTEA